MQWLKNMKINGKLFLGFLLMVVLAGIVGYFLNMESKLLITFIAAEGILAVLFGLALSRSISQPLKRLAEAADQLAEGNLDVDIHYDSKDEIGGISSSFTKVIGYLRGQADTAEKIVAGDLKVEVKINSDKDLLSKDMKKMAENLQMLIGELDYMANQHSAGDIDVFASEEKFSGAYKDLVKGVNDMVKGHEEDMLLAMDRVKHFAKGDFDIDLKVFPGKKILINENMEGLRNNIKSFISEMNHMSAQHDAGDIDVFVPEEKFLGDFKSMAQGVNGMVKNHISVKKKAMSCVAEFAKGNFDAELEKFPGKKAFINENIEGLRKNVKEFIAEMNHMSMQHDAGDIDVFVPEEKFLGDFKSMAQGVNGMVKNHISVKKKAMSCVAEFAKGNFDAELEKFPGKKAFINDNLEALRKNLKDVNTEINELILASKEGRLSERANAQIFTGGWAILMRGLNELIDAIIEPVQEAAVVLEEMSKGNLQVSVNGNYKGDHAKIKDALNDSIETLSSYVNEISTVLNEMSENNLDVWITREYRGDFEEIKVSINKIIQARNDIMRELKIAAEQVASGSRQVSDSSISLSQGSTEQASSIEQLTASLEEISSQTQLNAEHATHANGLAENVKTNAVKGNVQMKEMLKAMEEINDASANISKIIKVIDDIAFQTNILALNAAVEAARAGQHGKGFAVVAEEVRNLAARSANAAKETTDLIEGSIRKVEGGTNIANQTADALNKIVDGVTEVADLVGDIATASNEQASGIAQVNQGIMQVSEVVQTISATSEEGASASEELASQAEVLKGHVSRFKLRRVNSSNDPYEAANRKSDAKKIDYYNGTFADVVPVKSQRIALSDSEFGKYSESGAVH